MDNGRPQGWDVLPAIAAAIGLVMIGLYIGLINQQDGEIAVWFVVGLAVAALLSAYGAVRTAPLRVWVLAAAGAVMCAFGVLGILSIGLPILVAGVLDLIAVARAGLRQANSVSDGPRSL
jgi:hypothetical protein